MAKFILANTIPFEGVNKFAGEEINDKTDDAAKIAALGGILIPIPNAQIEAIATRVRAERGRGKNGSERDLLFAAWSIQSATGGGGGGGVLVSNAGVSVPGTFTTLDMQAGLTVSDAGAGVAAVAPAPDALLATASASGFMSAAAMTALLAIVALSPVPSSRSLTAGTGLTGGGDLSADRTFNVIANADGSIVANANDIQVGVLATDAQHGNRGGGGLHANVIAAGASGFMTGADKTKLDAYPASASSLAIAGDVTGTTGASVVENISGNSGTGLATILDSASIQHGTNPATTGNLRLKHAYSFRGRDSTNATNHTLFDWGGLTTDTLTIASTTSAVILRGTTLSIADATPFLHGTNPATAGNRRIKHAYVEQGRDSTNANNRALWDWGSATADTLTIGNTSIALAMNGTALTMGATPITLGTNPSTAGSIRSAHNSSSQGRDNANANNRTIWSWGVAANDTAAFGDVNVAAQINATTLTINNATAIIHGTTPSTTGDFRFKQGYTFRGRNNANSADIVLMGWGSSFTDTLTMNGFTQFGAGIQVSGGIILSTSSFQFASSLNGSIQYTAGISGNARNITMTAQPSTGANGNGGAVVIQGGIPNGTGFKGGVQLNFNGTTEVGIEIAQVVASQRVIAVCRGAAITSTQVPSNTGDLIAYWANCATAPTANSVSGGLVYEEGGAFKHRGTSGTVTTMAAA